MPFDPNTIETSAAGATFPLTTDTDGWTIVDRLALLDALTHSYRTDPTKAFLVPLAQTVPLPLVYEIYVHNELDQAVTIQPVKNQFLPVGTPSSSNPSEPDYNPGQNTSFTVPAGTYSVSQPNQLVSPGVGAGTYPFYLYPAEYLAVQITPAAAPTKGTISVVILLYYGSRM